MAHDDRSRGQLALELLFADSQVQSASFAPTPGGEHGVFSCSLGQLDDAVVAKLERAASERAPVRLLFSACPLLLDLVTIERKGPRTVRIVGRVVTEVEPLTGN